MNYFSNADNTSNGNAIQKKSEQVAATANKLAEFWCQYFAESHH